MTLYLQLIFLDKVWNLVRIAVQRKIYLFGNRAGQSGPKFIGLEEDTFDVGASSDPAKFSKSLKSIVNYIQKTYKMPDNIMKAIQ